MIETTFSEAEMDPILQDALAALFQLPTIAQMERFQLRIVFLMFSRFCPT